MPSTQTTVPLFVQRTWVSTDDIFTDDSGVLWIRDQSLHWYTNNGALLTSADVPSGSQVEVILQFGTVFQVNVPGGPAPTNTTPPSITSTETPPSVGAPSVLTCNPGVWDHAASFTFLWQHGDGSAVTGPKATDQAYVIDPGDLGFTILCQVTGTNINGNLTVNAPATAAVAA